VSVAEASEAIGLSKITVLRRLRSGQWPGGKSGRKWLVSSEFVRAVAAGLESPLFVVEDFAAAWMARGTAEAVA
jgi:excisionase family DNA binding protein